MERVAYTHAEHVAGIQHAIQQRADVILAIVSLDLRYRLICCVTKAMSMLSDALV